MNHLLGRALVVMAALGFPTVVAAQVNTVSLGSSDQQIWYVQSDAEIGTKAKDPQLQISDWIKAIVPGTTFSSFVAAGKEADPNFGDNIYKVDRSKYDRDFWYRTTFKVPATYAKKRVWLNFNGVNRKASVYLNGKLIGHLDGFMDRGHFDITNDVGADGNNVLAVLVSIPIQPLANVGSPNYVASAGWDWIPYVPV
ncbi:glycosyl hydrolase 2 galactose-binding domain-containing protein [Chitinophaga pinensis]|uniref:glycosyl hydrolase 2 galactose-binding domain-containing protein n=1 Tax=Chitinophaga pinensis TaxID=79329 RepID=UPI001C99196A|nr:sugar-binding domain-containing protein [Chitinophaga pinensis]